MKRILLFVVALTMFQQGCADSFDPASLITRVRITGTSVAIDGDLTRAWLRPDNLVDLRISVVSPVGRPPMQWNAVVCVPEESSFGVPFCDEQSPIVICTNCLGGSSLATDEPALSFTVPNEDDLGDAEELLVLGAFCANGAPISGDMLAQFLEGEDRSSLHPCALSTDEGEFLVARMPIEQTGMGTDSHPVISQLSREGMLWVEDAAPTDPLTPCGIGLPEIVAGSGKLDLTLDLASASFETFLTCDNPATCTATEVFDISWHTTSGEFGGSFTAARKEVPISLNSWKPPKKVEQPGGLLTRFNIVVRDQRGGVDWIDRALCVIP